MADANYKSDVSLIGFENAFVSNFEFINCNLSDVTMKGNSIERDYTYHPYVFAPDTGT